MLRKDDHSTQELSQRGSKNGPKVGVIGSYDEHPTMKLLNRLFIWVVVVGLATMLLSVSARAAGGLAFDRSGNLFVTDKDSDSILKFTPDGKKSTFATGISFHGAAVDGAGNVFAADGNTIFKVTPDGKKSKFASGLRNPLHLTFDDKGNLFVLEEDSHPIFKFTPDGAKSTFATGLSPADIAVDGAGNFFVTDKGSYSPLKFTPDGSILKFTPDGKKSTFASGLVPEDLAFDDKGNLFVADNGSDSILKFTPEGKKSTFATGRIGFYGMALDAAGNLFVLDLQSASILKFTPDGTRSTFALLVRSISPDQKWEHVGGDEPKIVKAGTNEVALDLSYSCSGSVDWSPDSKRFACYSGGGGRSHTTFLYQLRGDEWKELKEPIDAVYEILKKAIAAQVKKSGLPKKTDLRMIWETSELRRWVDSNTAILYAGLHEAVRENLERRFDVDFVFTLKFDDAGSWKIVKTHQMSDKEIEKEDAGEDVSGPAQTTDQEGLSADASFREADRHLNEVYNALRVRLSPSESDTLKKEQLAWINQRNAAGQLAKGNAEGNPTDAADREVTKMTLARAAELEKRLKKAK